MVLLFLTGFQWRWDDGFEYAGPAKKPISSTMLIRSMGSCFITEFATNGRVNFFYISLIGIYSYVIGRELFSDRTGPSYHQSETVLPHPFEDEFSHAGRSNR